MLIACIDTNITEPPPPAGGTIWFASNREGNNFEIYRVAGNGANLTRLTTDPANDRSPVPSPDGSRVVWVREIAAAGGTESLDIWVMNADGSDPRPLVSNSSFNDTPAWTPDGSALVYASFVTGNWEVFRIAADGSGTAVNLTNNVYADQHPRVSPDGATIVFQSNRDLQFEIYAMDADGSNPRNLTSSSADDRFPGWTPDGGTIVWSRFTDTFDLYAMTAGGASQRVLMSSPFEETQPSVSPDGGSIVFQTDRLGSPRFALFVIPVAGGDPRPVIDVNTATGSDLDPYWAR